MENEPIIVERTFDAPVSKVWSALTDKNEMKSWYFDLAEFKPEMGFEFEFNGGPPETQYRHLCVITEASPQQKLSYSWRYDGYEGISYVAFELFPKGDQTLLKLTHTRLESFPKDNKDFAKGNFVEGWNAIINTSLKNYLEPEQ